MSDLYRKSNKLIFNKNEIAVLKYVGRIYNLVAWVVEGIESSPNRDDEYSEDLRKINYELELQIKDFTKKFEGRVYKWMERLERSNNENWKYEYELITKFAADMNTWELESDEMFETIEWMEESGLVDYCSLVCDSEYRFDYDYDFEKERFVLETIHPADDEAEWEKLENRRRDIVKIIDKVNKTRGM